MIRRILIASLALLALSCRSSVDIVISRHVDPDGIKRIAIFKMDRLSYRENDKISDLLIHEFLRLGYDVVERTEIEKLIKEQKLGASGFVDPDQAVAIGKMAGADSIVIGSGALEDKSSDVLKYFVVKIIDLKSGSVVITANLVKNRDIKTAIADLSSSLQKSLEMRRAEKSGKL
jgi:Curli production assembly/transport component CsgG